MISIVVCSKNILLYNKLAANIAETIGVPFELIRIDNSSKSMGICRAYNQGAAKSKYEILCFAHEDVRFTTNKWGVHVCNHFKNNSVGAIGIAGASYKLSIPSSWSVAKGYRAAHFIQFYSKRKKRKKRVYEMPGNTARYRVNSLDGVLIIVKKQVWQTYPFDETNITGFHGYDLDFCFAISLFTSLYVVFDITIEHFSEGKPDKHWLEAAMLFCRKWERQLPACVPGTVVPHSKALRIYKEAVGLFYKRLNKFGYSRFQVVMKMRRYGIWKEDQAKSLNYLRKLLGR